MKNTDLIRFLITRAKRDSFKGFAFRLLRFAIILPYKLNMWLWWKRLQRMFLFYGNTYLAVHVKGNFMRLNMLESGIARDLLYNREREPYSNFAFISMLEPEDIVIDIGANIGYYALQEARIAKQVYAIEPNPESVNQLTANICQSNLLPRIRTYQMAIGDYDGKAMLDITDDSNLCNLSSVRDCSTRCEVPISTLDNFIKDKQYPTVIRMDVEGYEYEIVKGMQGILAEDKPLVLFIELHMNILGSKVQVIAHTLKLAGFEIYTASLEPHPAVLKHRLGRKLTGFCDRMIGAPQGYVDISIQDLIDNSLYSSGQVEWLEVIFRR